MDCRDKIQLKKCCNFLFCIKQFKSYDLMMKGGHLGFLGYLNDTLLLSALCAL